MAEKPEPRFNWLKLRWADGGTPEPVTEPVDGQKDTGWAFGDIHPEAIANYHQQKVFETLRSILIATPRCFEFISDAFVAAVSSQEYGPVLVNEFFRVLAAGSSALNPALANIQWTVLGVGGASAAVNHMACDSEQVYHAHFTATADFAANSPETGAQIWANALGADAITAMAADGLFLYTGHFSGVAHIRSRSDGSSIATLANLTLINSIAANGDQLAYSGTLAGGTLGTYSALGAAPVSNGTSVITGIEGVAVDDTRVYAVATTGGVVTLTARALSNPVTTFWTVTLNAISGSTGLTVETDGQRVYVGLTTASDQTLHCFNRDGLFLWTTRVIGLSNIDRLSVDDDYLYLADDAGNESAIVDKETGVTVRTISGNLIMCSDGWRAYGTDTAFNIRAYTATERSKLFERVSSADPTRRPFHKLAVPVETAGW